MLNNMKKLSYYLTCSFLLICSSFELQALPIWDTTDFDFFLGDPLSIGLGDIDRFVPQRHSELGGLVPGTPYIAWINNDVSSSTPDVVLAAFDSFNDPSDSFGTLLSFDDSSSPVGNGYAPALLGFVRPDGGIYLCASVYDDFNCDRNSDSGSGLVSASGRYDFYLKLDPEFIVPEPTIFVLISFGIAGIGFIGKKRQT